MTEPIKSASLLDFFEISKDCEKNSCSENYTYIKRRTKRLLYQIKNILSKLMIVIIEIFFLCHSKLFSHKSGFNRDVGLGESGLR